MNKIIIASVSLNGIIGRGGKTPWHSKSDLNHFRETTLDHPVVMGRRTFESIGNILDRRINIVLSRDSDSPLNKYPGVVLCTSLDIAYDYCQKNNFAKIFIIGGAQIFNRTINDADEMIISRINLSVEGDAKFPEIDRKIWLLDSSQKYADFELQKYVKTT